MRDLYKHLGLDINSTNEELCRSLDSISDLALRRDVEIVLKHPVRRAKYDRSVRVLRTIGEIRQAISVPPSAHWKQNYDEYFRPTQPKHQNLYRESGLFPTASTRASKNSAMRAPARNKDASFAVYVVIGFLAIILFLAILSSSGGSDTRSPSPSAQAETSRPPAPSIPAQPLPANGAVTWFSNASPVAPFEIKASGSNNFYVKLTHAYTGVDQLAVFVRAGLTASIEVPLGTYIVKYASGDLWYGSSELFGSETSYNKADENFSFTFDGYQYSGFTITLYQVAGGNLSTSRIRENDF